MTSAREQFPTADELEVLALALMKIHVFQPDFCNDWNIEKTDALLKKMEKCTESLRAQQEQPKEQPR
jgi:hypothetical protein